MQFEHTEKVRALIARLEAFFDEHIYPNEKAVAELVHKREGKARWEPIRLVEQLKPKARTMRIVDGPDEVHRNQIGRMELERYR